MVHVEAATAVAAVAIASIVSAIIVGILEWED